ncbi:heat shock factor 2-binding protein-like [Apostichopus japonicus]|uniref:heat shock factor 2-binding protein-like n=1 Tax=Stichopus japonicus TaxID=307972 RepID=UPI003AB2F573
MEDLVQTANENVQCLASEWNQLKLTLEEEKYQRRGHVMVSESDLHKLQVEISANKRMLNKLQPEVSKCREYSRELHEALANSESSLEQNHQRQNHLQSRCEALKSECDLERESKLKMQAELSEVSNQLSLQSEYCASMGAVCCTLLWRASQQEHMIPHLLAGSQMKSFLSVVSHTLESFLATYEEDMSDGVNEEVQFVLALVGTVTNVAASAVGREFLSKSSHSQSLIETFKHLLSKPPSKHIVRLKGLAIMALYNLSINQTGLKSLASTKGLVPLMTWLLSAEISDEMRLHTLLLLHSLVSEPKHLNLMLEVKEGMTEQLMQELSNHRDKDIREVFLEITQAVRAVGSEP